MSYFVIKFFLNIKLDQYKVKENLIKLDCQAFIIKYFFFFDLICSKVYTKQKHVSLLFKISLGFKSLIVQKKSNHACHFEGLKSGSMTINF